MLYGEAGTDTLLGKEGSDELHGGLDGVLGLAPRALLAETGAKRRRLLVRAHLISHELCMVSIPAGTTAALCRNHCRLHAVPLLQWIPSWPAQGTTACGEMRAWTPCWAATGSEFNWKRGLSGVHGICSPHLHEKEVPACTA